MRDRLLLPLLIPIGAAVAIFLLIFSVSRILLEVKDAYGAESDTGAYIATGIAIGGAVAILGICTLLAAGPRLGRQTIFAITALPVSVIMAIGLYISARPGEATEAGAQGPVTAFNEVATDNKFDVTAVTVPAGTEVSVTVENRGAATHNWHVKGVKDAGGNEIQSELKPGPNSQTVKFTIAQPGAYDFLCDAHPAEMKGTITVAEGVTAASGIALVGTDNKYDKTSLTVKAGEEKTITMENKGTGQHNFHLQGVKNKEGNDILTTLSGPGSKESVTFVIDKPGTYDFLCDAHPTDMKGKLTVQ